MTAVSLVLGGIVLVYTVIYAIKSIKPIRAYEAAYKMGHIKKVTGTVIDKIEEKSKAHKGEIVSICFPKYEFKVDEKVYQIQSTVPYVNVSIGDPVEIEFDERTGSGWAAKDIPLMKKNLIVRVLTIACILILLIVTDVLR